MMKTGDISENGKNNKMVNSITSGFRAIVVAGTHSGCGKTTITLGLMAALRKRGFEVQSFKAGPDFIDAGIHGLVTGRPSRNLDMWMCGDEYVNDVFSRHSADADISVVEGVMGMFDGERNTAKLAALIDVPVILVVDASGAAESAGATVRGFVETGEEDFSVRFAGVVFNRVASQRHFEILVNSVRDVPVLGYLTRESDFEISQRHLGLVVAEESPISSEQIDKLANDVSDNINLKLLMNKAVIAEKEIPSKRLVPGKTKISKHKTESLKRSLKPKSIKMALASDKAFCFYYEDNLDMLKDAGFDIVPINLLNDSRIPENIDAIYIGGGYPELHAKALSGNVSLLKYIKEWADEGKPVYAECGGLMYLSKSMTDLDGERYDMAGVFAFKTNMMKRPRLGYREAQLTDDCCLGKKGDILRGHEFHYSETKGDIDTHYSNVYSVRDNYGTELRNAMGCRYKNTLASYIHVHFGSNRHIAENFAAFVHR